MKKRTGMCILMLAAFAIALILQGCGGGIDDASYTGYSTVSGTVSDINRNTIIGARVWTDSTHETESLVSGAYSLENIEDGWTTIRASATINGQMWVGSTAAQVLYNEPTMNINIVLSPAGSTTTVSGTVKDDTGRRVSRARVLLTTRTLSPQDETSSYDGPYSSIVAVTNNNGGYIMEDVPVGLSATISASKVGFENRERAINTTSSDMTVNFSLVESDLRYSPDDPILEAIESYTMPDSITRSDVSAFRAVKAFRSPRFRKAIAANPNRKQAIAKATPLGSLIEIDLYWNALDLNNSRDIAGYGIYRATSPTATMKTIDFVRDPYANFYADTGAEITPYQNYYYAVSSVDVEFLNAWNNFDSAAESDLSNILSIAPLGQLKAGSPAQGASTSATPTFTWTQLSGATSYTIYVYDKFPALPLDPSYDYGDDPITDAGVFPVWPRQASPNESTVSGSTTSRVYNGPALTPGHTYYWLILASDGDGAYSYSQLRHFTP